MLKVLSILTVLLVVAQSPLPVPAQTANDSRLSRADQSAQHIQGPAASTSAIQDAAKSHPPRNSPAAAQSEDLKESVTITRVVPVSVERDWLDYATWVGGLALLVVGILGVRLANRTLNAIEKQAVLMKEQSDLMVEKERAKLRIELETFRAVLDEEFGTYNVVGHVSIYGSTDAFIGKTEIYTSVGVGGILDPLPEWLWGLHLDPVIRAHSEPIRFEVIVMAKDGPATEEELLPVREAAEYIYCMAKIEFTDTFGKKWVYRLMRRFRFIFSQVGLPDVSGNWEDCGPITDNGEFRAEVEQRAGNYDTTAGRGSGLG